MLIIISTLCRSDNDLTRDTHSHRVTLPCSGLIGVSWSKALWWTRRIERGDSDRPGAQNPLLSLDTSSSLRWRLGKPDRWGHSSHQDSVKDSRRVCVVPGICFDYSYIRTFAASSFTSVSDSQIFSKQPRSTKSSYRTRLDVLLILINSYSIIGIDGERERERERAGRVTTICNLYSPLVKIHSLMASSCEE